MSRLGRDYLQVGYYTDSYFPDHSIRFIAINDCVDSDEGENELAPFRNVMNEMYARDISRKVRSSHRLRGNAGEPLAQPPYGYKKSPENKKWWIIDPEAAAVVRDIFAMAMEGKGNETIAGILQARKVLIPMAYWREKGLPRGGKVSQPDPYKWCKSTVEKILRQQEYCGDIVNFKTYSKSFKNKVRTFCQNPGGFVAQENYDNDLAVVNGHSFKEKKSNNTNLAILVSHNFTEPFNQPIAYAQKVGELTNMLGAGHILVQRYGDILDGKRTWANELARTNVRPTLKDAVAGDITAAMPYRAMVNIIEFIKMMDEVVPGFASPETLLYSPELKFYSNKVKMDTDLETNIAGLHCLGDSSGWTRGLMMASVMGVLMGRKLLEKHGF